MSAQHEQLQLRVETQRNAVADDVSALFAVVALRRHSTIARHGERNLRASALGYTGSVVLMLLLFPRHVELALSVLAILAFGDGSATLGGLLIGGRPLPWNRHKTWAGLICL